MTIRRRLKIAVSGVRGVVGETFSPLLVSDFASAFGEFVGRGLVLVGRDTRRTGELFEHAVCAGLSAVGAQVVLAGIVPTPSLQLAVRSTGASGAIMITASHNPVEWNALKFINSEGFFLDTQATEELLDIYNQPDLNFVPEQAIRPVRELKDIFNIHKNEIFKKIDQEAIRKAKFRVAVDCCNGVGALYTRPFLEELGAEVFTVFDSPDIPFEREPEPVPKNISALKTLLLQKRCDIGFAQDPDGDRISLIDEAGNILGVQNSLLPATAHILSRNPGSLAVANIQTTHALEQIAEASGSRVIYTSVGEVNVTNTMRAENAVLGIEGSSGGLIVPSIIPCRDSFTAMALTLEMMALRKESLSKIISTLPLLCSTEKKFECAAQTAVNALREITVRYAEYNPISIDGVRIDFEDSWVLMRQSNTEPVIRVLAEAPDICQAEILSERFINELKKSVCN